MPHPHSRPAGPAPGSVLGSHVTRTLRPGQRGALKQSLRYGDALVCVRHRLDASGRVRFTTVELLVETVPVGPRSDSVVGLRIAYQERDLQTAVRGAGGTWDPVARLWRLPLRAVRKLRLNERIVSEEKR